jgi:hypothetical protein
MKPSVSCLLLFVIGYVQGLGKTILEGDVYIELIGAIYVEPGNEINSTCRNIEAETVQNIQAIKWTLSRLNDLNYINNLKIGKCIVRFTQHVFLVQENRPIPILGDRGICKRKAILNRT